MTRRRAAVWVGASAILGVAALAFLLDDPARQGHAGMFGPAWIKLVDPDEDDVAEHKLKTRLNGDGSVRAVIEFELQDVTPGLQYEIRVEVTEVGEGAAPIEPLRIPPLEAQPGR